MQSAVTQGFLPAETRAVKQRLYSESCRSDLPAESASGKAAAALRSPAGLDIPADSAGSAAGMAASIVQQAPLPAVRTDYRKRKSGVSGPAEGSEIPRI
jgi:hypothetical protein